MHTQSVVGFKIWYSRSTYIGHTFDDWLAAPADDVQAVVVYLAVCDALGRYTRIYSSGHDYYAMAPDMSFRDGDDLAALPGHVLAGAWMDFDGLLAIEAESFADYGEGLGG